MNRNRLYRALVAASMLGASGFASGQGQGEPMTGVVDFDVSCEQSVREDFDRALGLMHHMMYEQARAGFQAIAEVDPACAMAHWGLATTLFQPLWPERPDLATRQRGWETIRTARNLGTDSEREQHLIDATAAFFHEPQASGYWERIFDWAEGMEHAYASHPGDPDTGALYALSRLAIAGQVEDGALLRDQAEQILRRIWEQEPSHPGAVHYTIHATDAEGRAENALDIVASYSDIAPEVPHALHMPSHIYVRLGDWPAVIEWNRRSAAAVSREPVNGGLALHYIHAIDYLVYAYLQQGRDDSARAAYETAMQHRHQPTFLSTFHAAAMPARLAVEPRNWDAAVALEPGEPAYLPWNNALWAEGLVWYARGLGGVQNGDLGLARDAEAHMMSLRDQAETGGEQAFATYIDVDRHILAGRMAYANGDTAHALEQMHRAAELEVGIEKSPVTPGALLPPNEALGDLLMELGRAGEALKAYQASDATWPGRFNTLLGAARAADAVNDEQAAAGYYRRLLDSAVGSDRPQLDEARAFLNQQ